MDSFLDKIRVIRHGRAFLAMGTEFYNDQGKALVGLKGSKEKKKTVIANKMLAVLLKYLNICMTKNFPQEGNMGVLKEYFATVVPPCVNLCITIKRKDIVFENVWSAFQVSKFLQIFQKLLLILKDETSLKKDSNSKFYGRLYFINQPTFLGACQFSSKIELLSDNF